MSETQYPSNIESISTSQIHPIFQLSFADCFLSFLWIIGGALWLREDHNRVGCLVVALLTVVSTYC